MKKILVALAVSILTLTFFVGAATGGSCGTNVTWSFDSATSVLTISGSGDVTTSPWSSYGEQIKSIVVENNVKSLGNGVFKSCTAVEEITLPFIGYKESATAASAVLGYPFGFEFSEYNERTTSNHEPTLEQLGFGYQYVEYNDYTYTAGGHVHEDWFYDTWKYNIPKTLKKVTLTKGTARGFVNSGVEEVVLGANVTKIAADAFRSTSALESIEILGTANIADGAFKGSGYYNNSDNWEDGALYIGRHLIEYANKTATEYTVKADTVRIAQKAFLNCTNLEKITLPQGIDSMTTDVFNGCTSVKEMTVPFSGEFVVPSVEKLTILKGQIFNNVFKGYSNLKEVILADGVTSIGSNAFENCSSLSLIVIPSSVTAFGDNIFNSAVTICGEKDSVAQLYAAENNIPFVTCIHSFGAWITENGNTYRECTICGEVESAVEEGYCGETVAWSLDKIAMTLAISGEGDMDDYSDDIAPWMLSSAYVKNICIEDGITSIGVNAFKNCSMAKEIVIPESVTAIGDGALTDCLEATVKAYIGSYAEEYAIRRNFRVEALDIADRTGDGWSYYETAGRLNINRQGALSKDSAWSDFASSIKSVWISDSVTSISDGALREFTSLEEIRLPFIGGGVDAEEYESVFGYIFGYEWMYGYLYFEEEWQSPDSTYQYTVDCYINGELDDDYSEYYCYFIPKTLRRVIFTGTEIPERAFYNCNMLDKVIAVNVTSVGLDAFKNSKATAYAYTNSALHKYAISKGIPFEAYCTAEAGHNCTKKLTSPTCTAEGYTTYTCEICSYTYKGDYTAKLKHEYKAVVTPPTCTADGYTTYTCTSCGDTYKGDTVKANGHSFGEWIKNEGYTTSYHKCSVCSTTETKTTSGSLSGNIKWFIDLNTATLYLTGTGATSDYTSTSSNALQQNKLYYTSVVIGEGITTLGEYLFNSNGYVKSVSLPSTLTTIKNYAFNNCPVLKKVSVPSLSQWLSFDFTSYTQNPLYTGNAQLYVGDELLEELVIPSDVTTIKSYSFAGCTSIKSVVLPDTVLNINNAAFYGCKALTSIKLSKNMTQLPSSAFQGCTALEEVTIPENITKINYNAFKGCTALKKATVLLKTTSFGSAVFGGCTNLTIYGLEGSRAETYAKNNSIPFKVITDDGCTEHSFGKWTISGNTATRVCTNDCDAVETLVVGGSCGTNAVWSFDPNTGVLTVSGSGDMAKYTTTALAPWSHLTEIIKLVNINGVKLVGNYAFIDCTALESVVMGDSVETVGSYAFSGCTSLKEVRVGSGLTKISTKAFINCTAIEKVHIPSIELWCGISFLTVESNPASVSGALFVNGEEITDAIIGDGVTEIGEYAFRYVRLKSVSLPEGLTSIGKAAFAYCTEITEITVPKGVTAITTSAFKDCSKLKRVVLSSGVTSIGNQSFQNCVALEVIEIPESVTSIYETAFEGCDALTIKGVKGSYAESFATEKNIPFEAKEHTFSEWDITLEATCDRDGIKTRSCTVCGEIETEVIKSEGHNYKAVVTAPTCDKGGYTTHTCTVCGDKYTDSKTEAKGHSFGDWIVDIEPTVEQEGSRHRDCTVCFATEGESIPKLVVTGDNAVFTLSGAKAKPGDTFKLTLSLKADVKINSIAIPSFKYDADILEFVGFGDYEAIEDMPVLTAMFDDESGYILIGFTEDIPFDGVICTLEFKVREGVESTTTTISASPIVKLGSVSINAKFNNAEVEVIAYLEGDIDSDNDVDLDDAVLLFANSMLPEYFPVDYPGDMDFNNDGNVDIYDAIKLFNYSMLPDIYPLG